MKKKWLIASSLVFFMGMWGFSTAYADTVQIKAMEMKDPTEILLSFSGPILADRIQTEYVNDTIQLSIKDATIAAPLILKDLAEPLQKVFAYQFSEKVVRCRITVNGSAASYQGKLSLLPESSFLRVQVGDKPVTSSQANEANPAEISREEATLLEKVTQPETPKSVNTGPSLRGFFIKWLSIVGFMMLALGAMVRLKKSHEKKPIAWLKNLPWLGQVVSKDPKMIQIISTHFLAPKKNLTVVRIAGQLYVLGVTDQNIQLITQLDEEEPEKNASFNDVMQAQAEPQLDLSSVREQSAIRSRIKDRLEGLKPL